MKVALLAAPIEALRAPRVREVSEAAWKAVRPEDDISAAIISDAVPVIGGSAGLEDVIGGVEVCRPGGQARLWQADTSILIDATSAVAVTSDTTDSVTLGEDIAWAIKQGCTTILIALPAQSSLTDCGIGMLEYLAGTQSSYRCEDFSEGIPEGFAADVARACQAVAGVRITVIAPAQQRLTGFQGVARMRIRDGVDPRAAQQLDAQIAAFAEALIEVTSSPARALLGDALDMRGVYSGAGGGSAFVLEALGAHVYPVGDISVRARLAETIREADIVVYISSDIAIDLPSGLLTAHELVAEGVPVVLVYDHGGIAKGELKALGLAGAYELRPDMAFMPRTSDTPVANGEDMATLLEQRIHALARTWGW